MDPLPLPPGTRFLGELPEVPFPELWRLTVESGRVVARHPDHPPIEIRPNGNRPPDWKRDS